ncbi:hypothetical protein A6A07_30700 [Streptomyces sp. CB03911]|nr:hypothetical protein A6A07_30700 [Streptomyces sp. CB03911]
MLLEHTRDHVERFHGRRDRGLQRPRESHRTAPGIPAGGRTRGVAATVGLCCAHSGSSSLADAQMLEVRATAHHRPEHPGSLTRAADALLG